MLCGGLDAQDRTMFDLVHCLLNIACKPDPDGGKSTNFIIVGICSPSLWDINYLTFNIRSRNRFIPPPLTEDRDIDLAEDRWDFGMAAGYGLTEFLSEDGVRLVTRDDIDMAVMEDGSCLVVILRGRNLPDSC